MRRPLAALALAVTLTVGTLPASAADHGSGGRSVVLEIWDALQLGWLVLGYGGGVDPWGGDLGNTEYGPGGDPDGRESVTSEYGAGVDPYGRCSGTDCPPPPAAQATTDDPGH